jgi:divalent metal cation (Fe/Co/Zn/Cd) transporter
MKAVEDYEMQEFWGAKVERVGGLIVGTLFVLAGAFSLALAFVGQSKPQGQTLFWSVIGALMGAGWVKRSWGMTKRRRALLKRYKAQH